MSEEKITKLPHLPLHPETRHITQEMADRIIDHLVEHYPERIEKIRDADQGHNNGYVISTYAEAMAPVSDEMSKIMEVPQDYLGYIDLDFELIRRFRAYAGLPVPEVKGKPLAPTPKGPFPPALVGKPINEETMRDGFNQTMVDEIAARYYAEFPEWCYIQGEAYRREIGPDIAHSAPYKSRQYFDPIVLSNTKPKVLSSASLRLENEIASRIRRTCEI